MTKSAVGLPKRRPRGKPFIKGVSPNPGGKPKGEKTRVTTTADVRLLAREHGPDAIRKLAKIMNDEGATHMAQIASAIQLLDRGWGRPPQSLEVYDIGVNVNIDRESALEFIAGKLAELEARARTIEAPALTND